MLRGKRVKKPNTDQQLMTKGKIILSLVCIIIIISFHISHYKREMMKRMNKKM